MPPSVRQRRRAFATGLLLALAVSFSGCSSTTSKEAASAADQKSYGAKMAQRGFWREALFRFDRASKLAPDDPEVLNNLAVASEAVGETARALAAYKRALELRPGDEGGTVPDIATQARLRRPPDRALHCTTIIAGKGATSDGAGRRSHATTA